MKNRIFLSALLFAFAAVVPAIAAPKPILPLKPSDLVTCLPSAPQDWTMITSTGRDDFSGGWMRTYAERDFKQNPLPSPAPGLPPPIPATMQVFVTDSGYKDNFEPLFTVSKAGSASANLSYFKVNNFPARLHKIDEQNAVLDLLVKSRFLVEFVVQNMRPEDLKKYATALDFTKLLETPDSGETKINNPVVISRVDELHPQNNRSYAVSYQVATPTPSPK